MEASRGGLAYAVGSPSLRRSKMKTAQLCLLVFLLLSYIWCLCFHVPSSRQAPVSTSSSVEPAGAICYIPTVKEIQQALCNAGYEVEVDYVVGEETKRQWDRFCANRYANQFTGDGYVEKRK